MDCRNCSTPDREATERTLQLVDRDGDSRTVTVPPCEPCVADFLALDWIDQPRVAADDD